MKRIIIFLIIVLNTAIVYGKVDLVTLPKRDTVQLTIYNSADLTLARESRSLTLDQGANKLQFSWENTLIDPTSLEMLPKANADKINIADLVYPPRVNNLGLWNISSEIKGRVPVEISYLTSGLSWRAFYMGTLTPDEKTMRLEGYVRVTNNSGEDYENAQVRLIVGQVHILDQIAELARRQWPYGRPGGPITLGLPVVELKKARGVMLEASQMVSYDSAFMAKEVKKEGLSEYFLYTIEGTETIPTGWSKRMISFEADEVPVVNLYKFEEERYGNSVVRFLSFKNDKAHKLGETPIPGGLLKVYRGADEQGHLSYTGQSEFKYIPVEEEVELNLGPVADVVVESKLMDFATENYEYENPGRNISGWDEVRTYTIEVRNTRDIPVEVEIKRNFPTQYRDVEKKGDFDKFEDVDLDTVKFVLKLEQQSVKKFEYTVRTYHGTRQEDWKGGATEPVKSLSGSLQQVDDAQGYLVSLWRFDENSGSTAYDSVKSNNGTIYGAKWTSGQFGSALSFNGNGDYVDCGNDKSLNIDGGITVVAWIYPQGSFWGGIIDKGDNTAGHDDYGLWFNDGKIEFSFNWPERWNVYPDGDRFIGATIVPLNKWSYFAGTWNGDKVRLYVNGRLDSEFNWTQGINSSSASVYIGVNPGGEGEYFNGIIDEAAIYNKALSAEQIRQLYQNNQKG